MRVPPHRLLLLAAVLHGCATAPTPAVEAAPPSPTTDAPDTAPRVASTPGPDTADSQAEDCPRSTVLSADAVEAEVVCLLQRYVRIDTTNPPGNELVAAQFLQRILQREGIESRVLESAPGRANIYARLPARPDPSRPGAGPGKALVLMHHMDVVPADAAEWTTAPFGAELRDGHIWGRGSLDNKGTGILDLVTMLMLHRLQVPLQRDIILLGVADEEAGGGAGARWLMQHHFELFEDVAFVLNEGGAILQTAQGQLLYNVELAQKAPLWLRITASGKSGHGSTPQPDASTHALVRALARLEGYRFPIKVLPEVQAVFTARAQAMPEPARRQYMNLEKSLKQVTFREAFLAQASQAVLVRNTLAITMLSGSTKENVLPATASAVLDLRLLPGEDPAAVTETLVKVMAEPTLRVETLLSWQGHASSRDTPLFTAITALAAQRDPGAPVVANVIGGFTDCNAFRARGVTCYGFVPMQLSMADVGRLHGKDERIPVDALTRGVVDLAKLIHAIE